MGGGAFVLIIAIVLILLVRNWPFTQQAVAKTLEDRFARQVVIKKFQKTYFPPGCIAECVSFLHRKRKDLPPLITISKLVVKGSYAGLIRPSKRIADVDVVGLHVTVPPSKPGSPSSVMPLTDGASKNTIGIDTIVSKDAVLEFIARDPAKEPFKLTIQKLVLDHVAETGPVSFRALLTNTEPPGSIAASGKFGPWNSDDPGATPMSGSYTFNKGNLAVFHGVTGVLSAKGTFQGAVRQAKTSGSVNVANFHIDGSTHNTQLSARYQADVDAENGDVSLESVETQIHRTTLLTQGSVASVPGQKGKTVGLEVGATSGRIEDLLLFFTSQKQPSMSGALKLHAKIQIPPGSGFLQKFRLTGDFGISNGRFTNAQVQTPLNHVSKSAEGENKTQEQQDPRTVPCNVNGHVEAQNGIATLTGVTFSVPGGVAQMRGTYNLVNTAVDIQGVLRTTGQLSDATSGFKSLFLKVVTPFVKKNKTTIVPFTIKGTSSSPAFALDLDGKRKI